MNRLASILSILALFLPFTNAALKIASALGVIEWTPEKLAKEDFYNGTVSIVNGGVPSLFSDSSVDLASNAETQALRNYASHKNLRIIYTVSEVAYRIVADKRKIKSLADLKGKHIGSVQGTSSGYFVQKMMESAGISTSQYTSVSGSQCLSEPCGDGTFPNMLAHGKADAIGFWEPTVELAARAIGSDNAIFFQNFTVYREIFNLHTTAEKLADKSKRAEIVAFLRALEKTLAVFRDQPDKVYARAAAALSPPMSTEIMKAVWPVHKWTGTVPEDLESVLSVEDSYVAKVDNRQPQSAATLKGMVDRSVLEEARAGM
ncbi:periplasmic binding protein-like II [Polyplosphaeria fusca]|uniref:Periplasmic binding protein-like II n=1 Tax=Polyplosphaeria fusca TaxID=682080 RepID=A0A9P4V4J6_9PLEO|nr:periplasmic binding protein-like II [Polyplosphaeria fusca]